MGRIVHMYFIVCNCFMTLTEIFTYSLLDEEELEKTEPISVLLLVIEMKLKVNSAKFSKPKLEMCGVMNLKRKKVNIGTLKFRCKRRTIITLLKSLI